MINVTTLKAERRTGKGTRASRRLRETGSIPAIIYGHGEPPESISLILHDLEVALAHRARTLDVEVAGTSKQYLIKEVQYDHLGSTPVHIDLARVSLDERVQVRVGIELRGVPQGVGEGGVLEQNLVDVEVECVVTQIPDTLHPLVTHLGIGDSLFVKDLEFPDGITILTDPNDSVATVRTVAEPVEEEAAEDEEKETAEPERIGRVRKDEEESGKS